MSLSSDLAKHQVFIQRLVGTEHNNIKKYLNNLRAAAKLAVKNGSYGAGLKNKLRDSMSGLRDSAIQSMTNFAEYESKFSAKITSKYVNSALKPVDAGVLKKALTTTNMQINNINKNLGNNKSLDNAYKQFSVRKADEITQVINDGRAQGLEDDEIDANIDEPINRRQSAQAFILALTAINFTTTLSRMETLRANKGIVDKVIWTLGDAMEHTEYCLSQEGEIYDVDDGPRPPAHYGCVSYMEPYIENE